ncbi:MAG: peptidoglycan editing factor PgeF [Pseudomonadota bacterium]
MTGAPEALRAPLLDLPGLRHAFFTRRGGVSSGVYGSLNCGGRRDAPDLVAENQRRAAAALGVPKDRLLLLYQTHSTRAVQADGPWPGKAPEADATVTATRGLAVGALAADCVPALFADPQARVVAAAHAGWRGALAGVLEATLDAMEAAGADRARIRVALGPCISQAHYEVGPEYVDAFTRGDAEATRFFADGPRGRPHFDLPGYALRRLREAGAAQADWIGRCTYADEARFFSNRRAFHRGEDGFGNLCSAIVLEDV